MKISAMGIAWYREEGYPAIRSVMADGKGFPVGYREWEQKAEDAERRMIAQGVKVVRVIIDPKTFPAWCRARGKNVDKEARFTFGNEEVHRRVLNGEI